VIDYLKNFFKRNKKHFEIKAAFLYGSQAGGLPRNDSDIDIAILFFDDSINEDRIFDCITDISLSLSRRLHFEVNIIPIHPDFRYPMLYYNAIVQGIPLFVNNFDEYIKLKNEAVFQMEDYNLFCRGWQIRIAKRNMEALIHD
jgi:predicted nucleotidyltransferase